MNKRKIVASAFSFYSFSSSAAAWSSNQYSCPITMFSSCGVRASARATAAATTTRKWSWVLPPPKRGRSWCIRQHQSKTRLFGSKARVPGNPPGEILIENAQNVLPRIDQRRLHSTIDKIRHILGYPTYDVSLYLVEDQLMQETNRETRGMDKPTDILSFQFHPHQEPGVLMEPEFDIPDFYNLGEMMIDVPYVIRQCHEDAAIAAGEMEDLYEDDEEEEEDRGVSGAMAVIYDPEERINMLLVHGMLHLVGHDHEEDDEYEVMVSKEEEILKELGMLPVRI